VPRTKRRRTHVVEAQFALPYLIAVAIVYGRVGITEVADIRDAQVLGLAARIDGVVAGQETSGITIWLSDGRRATVKVESPLGSPENRPSVEQLAMSLLTARVMLCGHCRLTQCLRQSR